MKKLFLYILRPLYIHLLGVCITVFSFYGNSFSQAGGQPGAFMSYGVGARALGMGGAFFAISDDATASYWNPAGLTLIERKELSFMQAQMFEQTSLNFIGIALPTASRGTFGIFMNQMTSSGFEKVSIEVDPNTNEIINLKSIGSFNVSERGIGLSWGRMVSQKLAFGVGIRNITRMVDVSQDSFKTIDLAMNF